MPLETVRRRLVNLVARNRCECDENGYWMSSRIPNEGVLVEFSPANEGNLHRLLSGLAELGVILERDRERDCRSAV
ncbi:MAG: hypothetical protein ACK56C_16660 [Alphaproteobacteria bacterium]